MEYDEAIHYLREAAKQMSKHFKSLNEIETQLLNNKTCFHDNTCNINECDKDCILKNIFNIIRDNKCWWS